MSHRRITEFFHNRTARTASRTSRHFNKTLFDVAGNDVFERRLAVLHTVYGNVRIVVVRFIHRVKHATYNREESCSALALFVNTVFDYNTCALEHSRKFTESKNRIYSTIKCFVLFG